jgi:hypothetical protein
MQFGGGIDAAGKMHRSSSRAVIFNSPTQRRAAAVETIRLESG